MLLRVQETAPAAPLSEATPEELSRQHAALRELEAITAKLPVKRHNDGLTARDHDKILYGKP